MQTWLRLCIILVVAKNIFASKSSHCFKKGECRQSFQISGKITGDQFECRLHCRNTKHCQWFTFYEKTSYCQLFKNCVSIEEYCDDCVSGGKDCTPPELKCWFYGQCDEEPLNTTSASYKGDCLRSCQADANCQWFSFLAASKTCHHYAKCIVYKGCTDCISGNAGCQENVQDSEWHLILGGIGSPNKAELYNWRTGQHCQLPDLPVTVFGHVATYMDGVPVFCEAGVNRRGCFKMDKSNKNWISISKLLGGVEFGKSVYVPSQGWMVFGSLGNNLPHLQMLSSVDGEWKIGMEIDPTIFKDNFCIYEVDKEKTGIMYSKKASYSTGNYRYRGDDLDTIVHSAIDWSIMDFVNETYTSGWLKFPSCYLTRDENGEMKIAQIIGKSDYGMRFAELTNPEINSQASAKFPPEELLNGKLLHTQLISVNNSTELYLFGGMVRNQVLDGIYRYSAALKQWFQVGKMIHARAAHTVTPVEGIRCP